MSFETDIAKYIEKFAPQYGICVYSPIIAQAILESASGTSELAVNACNYFGLKYNKKQPKRCPTSIGYYVKEGSEQNPDGSYYVSSVMLWQKFQSMEPGAQGYFDFLKNGYGRYDNLQGITDPREYLETIKSDGYATSIQYVDNCMKVIDKYNLTKYDPKVPEVVSSNYPKIAYTKLSPNYTSPRKHAIDTITIHCMAGNCSIETCGNIFADKARKASSNYGIGSDGRVGLYVEEKNRSWCSSNADNDHRAITIEVANDGGAPLWHCTDKAIASLIELVVDICRRNNIKRLVWSDNKNDRINHKNGCNMTVHRDFAAKSCPGEYLMALQPWIAEQVNNALK